MFDVWPATFWDLGETEKVIIINGQAAKICLFEYFLPRLANESVIGQPMLLEAALRQGLQHLKSQLLREHAPPRPHDCRLRRCVDLAVFNGDEIALSCSDRNWSVAFDSCMIAREVKLVTP